LRGGFLFLKNIVRIKSPALDKYQQKINIKKLHGESKSVIFSGEGPDI
jgi:hypothetical protein